MDILAYTPILSMITKAPSHAFKQFGSCAYTQMPQNNKNGPYYPDYLIPATDYRQKLSFKSQIYITSQHRS